MLNEEGWSLLMILAAVIALLGMGYIFMGWEKTMAGRLRSGGGAADTAMGLTVRAAGFALLGVIPGSLYLGGAGRILQAASLCAGLAVLLCWMLPKLRAQEPGALTAAEICAKDKAARMGLGAVEILSLLAMTAGALAMAARVLASVFSLHTTISLGAAALLSLLLAMLCGAAARKNMDRLGVAMAAGTVIAAFVLVQMALDPVELPLAELLAPKNAPSATGWTTVASDVLWGVGAIGLAAFAHRALAAESEEAARQGGRTGALAIALLALLCAGAGLLGRAADATLESQTAAETILIQIVTMESLPKPFSAVLTAGLTAALLLSAQAMMTEIGSIAAWDIALPLTGETREKPLMRTAMGAAALSAAAAFALALDPNRPLQDYALLGLLLSTVTAAFLWVRVCEWEACPLGEWIGLGLGAAAAVGWALIPATRQLGMIGAIPCAMLTLLPQLLIGRWTQKKAEKAALASAEPEKTEEADEPETEKTEETAEAEDVWAEAEAELEQAEEAKEAGENAAAEENETEAAEQAEEEKADGSFDL